MPEQFPYPTDGWSTGKMRKKGDKWIPGDADITEGARALGEQNPLIQSIEQQHQERMKTQGIPEKMKAVLPRSGVGAAEVRELEGLRKEKTQHLSQAGGQYDTKLTPAEEAEFIKWKGKHAPKDSGEDYDACAVREVREELGLPLKKAPRRLFKLAASAETDQEHVWVYRCEAEGPFYLHPEEIERGDWFTPSEIALWMAKRPEDFASALLLIWSRLKSEGEIR